MKRRSSQAALRPTSMVAPSAVITNSEMNRLRLPVMVRLMSVSEMNRLRLPVMVRLMSVENALGRRLGAFSPLISALAYHSICAMGTGEAFTCISVTRPLLKRIRRSAMGASAELCVMMSTVMPSRRQVSCSSCSTCLPV